jgi:transcriptional regulator of acetoin/glycerol metabolism
MRLARRRQIDRAWRLFVEDAIEPAGISADISQSWRRARVSYQIDPRITHLPRVLSPEALAGRCERDDVLRLAAPILRDFWGHLALSDHVLAFFDRDGWMLSMDGDRRIADRVEQIDFRPGVKWTEECAGTNGPGTALALGKPVEVFASEHFVAAWHPWSCAAAPIRVAGEQDPVGLIDVTGPWELQSRKALLVAKAIARTIEERLRAAASVRDEVVRHAFRAAHEAGDALVAVDARGRVIAVNDAAARRRIVDGGSLPLAMKETVAEVLLSRSRSSDGAVRLGSPDGLAYIVSEVRHESSVVGAILRVAAKTTEAHPSRARGQPSARYDIGLIRGRSEPLRKAVELARTAARNELPVVLSGESGTGKELFAHSIHAGSGRQGGPFVVVNCGCIPEQLVEAELFGYEAGTFTGAKPGGSSGRFEDADGGTLFLDEVSELPHQAQVALLRLLQEKEVVRLGGSMPRSLDVRIVAATNKPLGEEIRAKRFRRDLYYRLNVFSISVPSLRDRGDDIPLLAQGFLAEAEAEVGRRNLTLSADAVDALRAYSWPGNVRELKNVISRAAATAPQSQVSARDLLLETGGSEPVPGAPRGERQTLREAVLRAERKAILEALDACLWNFARAAQRLGVARTTLYRLLSQYGISRTLALR